MQKGRAWLRQGLNPQLYALLHLRTAQNIRYKNFILVRKRLVKKKKSCYQPFVAVTEVTKQVRTDVEHLTAEVKEDLINNCSHSLGAIYVVIAM